MHTVKTLVKYFRIRFPKICRCLCLVNVKERQKRRTQTSKINRTENANKGARRMEDAGTAEGREFDENDPLRSKTMRHSQTVCKTSNAWAVHSMHRTEQRSRILEGAHAFATLETGLEPTISSRRAAPCPLSHTGGAIFGCGSGSVG